MTQKAEYMTLKRQALVLQAIAKDISDDEGVFYLSSFACQRSIEAIKQCSADLIKNSSRRSSLLLLNLRLRSLKKHDVLSYALLHLNSPIFLVLHVKRRHGQSA